MTVLPAKHLFTATEFTRIAESGALDDDARLELIEGEIIEMSPIGDRHAACVRRLNNLLARRLGATAVVDAQNPVRLEDLSQPQPDVTILAERADFYADGHPRPEDVLLLIEVAETSLAYDREVKLPIYARSGVLEVWLVDLNGGAVEVCRQPTPNGYAGVDRLEDPNARLTPEALPDLVLTVAEILNA